MDDLLNNHDIDMLNSIDLNQQDFKLDDNEILDSNGESMNQDENEEDENSFILDTETKTPGEILDEFCSKLKDVQTTLPETVVNHYMKKTGFIVNDPKLVKIISIASQKFISEIVNDVMQHHKLKSKSTGQTSGTNASTSGTNANQASAAGQAQGSSSSTANKNAPGLVLTLEDLSNVLTEYGINVKKPYYFM